MTRHPLRHPAGDFGRIVSCGVEGHPPTLDSCNECPACIAEEDTAEAARALRRHQARRRSGVGDRNQGELLADLARDVAAGDDLCVVAALGELVHRHDPMALTDRSAWRMVEDACWDRLADEDEREERERAAEEAAAQAEHINDCKENR